MSLRGKRIKEKRKEIKKKKKKKKSKDKIKGQDDERTSKKPNLDKKANVIDKCESPPVSTLGTQKKSSIFGGKTLSDDLMMPVVEKRGKE